MDSSTLTRRRQTRALFVDRIYSREDFNRGRHGVYRGATGVGLNSDLFKDNVLDKDTGAVNVTPAELDTYLDNEFGAPAASTGDYTYWIIYERSDTPYFYYAIYDKGTRAWINTQSSVSMDDGYNYDFTVTYLKRNYIVGFDNGSQTIMDILNTDGTIKSSILVQSTSISRYSDFAQDYFIYYYIDTNVLYMNRYNFTNDNLETVQLNITGTTYVNDLETLMEGIVFTTYDYDIGIYGIYVWPDGASTLTTVASCNNYSQTYNSNTNQTYKFIAIETDDVNTQYDAFKLIKQDGTIINYTLPAATYDSYDLFGYGDNRQYIVVKLYNRNTDLYDFFVFNNLPTMTPVIISGLRNNSSVTYRSSDLYNDKTYGSNHILISDLDYDGNWNYYETGTIHIVFEGATTPITQTYTSSNKVLNTYGSVGSINSDSILLIEKDNTYVKSHIYTIDGNTTTNLFSASDAVDGLNNWFDTYSFIGYHCPVIKIDVESIEKQVFYIIKNDNTVVATSIETPQDYYPSIRTSGKNIGIIYNDNTLAYCIDGVFTKTEETFTYVDNPYPDTASGVLFAIYNDTPYRVKAISSIASNTVDISLSNYDSYDVLKDVFFMIDDNNGPVKVTCIDKDGNEYYYEDPLARSNIFEDNIYNTDSSILFEIYNNDDDTRFYVIFDFESKTYTTLEQPPNLTNRRRIRSNYDYQWD